MDSTCVSHKLLMCPIEDNCCKVCTISFERPVKYPTTGTFSRPSTKRGFILIGLELNTNARESFEHC